ncbi:nucleotidyltransferase domain-containing protein [Streptomyces sp. UC4497]
MDHVKAAEQLVRSRFPDARAAFLAGSVLTERRTPRSDLDIVVLLSGPPAPYRESLHYEGWPAELFVQTEADWYRFVERETAARRSPLLAMCAEGLLLSDADGIGAELRAEAGRRWAAGPPPASEAELEELRYAVTDTLDDLDGCTEPLEHTYLVGHLLRRATELALLAGGHWLGTGKWLSRRLADADAELHHRLASSATAALSGPDDDDAVRRFTDVAREILESAGGAFWAGFRRG